MPEYLSPGVYVEEFEIGARPIEGVSTSTAGFIGETERGQTTPLLVTSWGDYQRRFGSCYGQTKYLPYAVQGFFSNGGKRCYIGRIVKEEAKKATCSIGENLSVEAVGEGECGNRVFVVVKESDDSTDKVKLFNLGVYYWKKNKPDNPVDPAGKDVPKDQITPTVSEVFENLSVDEDLPDFYEKRVNGKSTLIKFVENNEGVTVDVPEETKNFLEDGSDGVGDLVIEDYTRTKTANEKERKGLTAFAAIDEIAILYCPNAIDGVVKALIGQCENLKDRFAIIDSASDVADPSSLKPRNDNPTQYAAFYYPWLQLKDPESGLIRKVPPGGHIAGIYARSDVERGVHKAPANEVIKNVSGLEFQITTGEQAILNPRGVNVIRSFAGRGICVWGARTLSSNTLWKYINVRRLFIYIEESIEEGTQWVVFEPNNEKLWGRVKATITQFLYGVWRNNALMGKTADEAFFVNCDRSTMTQDDIDNGRLICVIGIAPVKPAEFVIFRIAQWAGGSSVME
ncbi:MAG: phage tail sheath family protein [Deltaproteobacteria bacterium]|nr:phage tail sheath family protein [Deltaproteobacteria bacterium]